MPILNLSPDDYAHLRALAGRIYAERGINHHTIQPTILLHEAWARMARADGEYASKEHFMATAARAMRQILVDRARAQATVRRGQNPRRTTLAGIEDTGFPVVDVLELDAAMTDLEAVDSDAVEVVLLRLFGGLTVPELSKVLELSLIHI